MEPHLRCYATDNLYHASVHYEDGYEIYARFPELETAASRLLKEVQKEGLTVPSKIKNGPTRHDSEVHRHMGETARRLKPAEERRFLSKLGINLV